MRMIPQRTGTLTAEELYLFDTRGFLHIPAFLGQETPDACWGEVLRLPSRFMEGRGDKERFDDLASRSAAFHELAASQAVRGCVEPLINQPYRLIESYALRRDKDSVFYLHNGNSELVRYGSSTVLMDLGDRAGRLEFLIRDRDSKVHHGVRQRLRRERHAGDQNSGPGASSELICGEVRGHAPPRVLDHILILGEGHLRQVLAEFARHYNEHRPHQSQRQDPPWPAGRSADLSARIERRQVLGGLISEYRRAA